MLGILAIRPFLVGLGGDLDHKHVNAGLSVGLSFPTVYCINWYQEITFQAHDRKLDIHAGEDEFAADFRRRVRGESPNLFSSVKTTSYFSYPVWGRKVEPFVGFSFGKFSENRAGVPNETFWEATGGVLSGWEHVKFRLAARYNVKLKDWGVDLGVMFVL